MAAAKKLPVAIIGATGYTGAELVRLLLHHPRVELAALTSRQYAGQPFSAAFPQFTGQCDIACEELDVRSIAKRAQFAFCCLPHHESAETCAALLDAGLKVVDLSADFRLRDVAVYEKNYGHHPVPTLIKKAVYGLPELYRARIKKAQLVANPGCYPTSVILGLAPALKGKVISTEGLIADSKSGVSGAGRGLALTTQFAEVHDGFNAYKALDHRHNCEIDQEISALAGAPPASIVVDFVPHLLPIARGILSTIYATLTPALAKDAKAREKILAAYRKFYANEPFVAVRDDLPRIQDVTMTNYCHIGVAVRGARLVIVSVLDNLTKGASGQAIQNMNLMMGWAENEALGR